MRLKIIFITFIPIFLVLLLANCMVTAQHATDQEIYETAVMALGEGHIDFALDFFNMLIADYPASEYAASASVIEIGIYLGSLKADKYLQNILTEGRKQANKAAKPNYDSTIKNHARQAENTLAALVDSYTNYIENYGKASPTLNIEFFDIGKNIDAVKEDLDKISRGVWVPLLIAPFDQVRLLYTYRELLMITGVDFSDSEIGDWIEKGNVKRTLDNESFFYDLGSIFFEENENKLAADALQRVIHLTRYRPYSKLRKQASDLLEELGISPEQKNENEGERPLPPTEEKPSQAGDTSILFDETRLIKRPTGELSGQIANTAWYGYSDLAAFLRAEGFVVGSLSERPITFEKLSRYDVFAILSTDHNHPYTYAEVVSIIAFVENGGGLLICESTWAGSQRRDYTVGALAYLFGVGFIGNGEIIDPGSDREEGVVLIRDLISHPITEDVTEVSMVEAAYIDPSGGTNIIGYSSKQSWFDDSTLPKNGIKEEDEVSGPLPVITILKPGDGRVIFLADGTLFTNGWINLDDNAKFALNVFQWLTEMP